MDGKSGDKYLKIFDHWIFIYTLSNQQTEIFLVL